MGVGGVLTPALVARNLTVNSDVAQNYKHNKLLSVRIWFLYLICITLQLKIYNHKHCDETTHGASWRSEAITQ